MRLVKITDGSEIDLDKVRLTSRSATEVYHSCQFRYFLGFHYLGQGISRLSRNIPLTTGIAIHKGVEAMLNMWAFNRDKVQDTPAIIGCIIDYGQSKALEAYDNSVKDRELSDTDPEYQEWTKQEQRALVQALVHVWGLAELRRLLHTFRIYATEQSLVMHLDDHVYMQAKVDSILQRLDRGDFVNYSLKTTKDLYPKGLQAYQHDLQGVTETLAVNHWLDALNANRRNAQTILSYLPGSTDGGTRAYVSGLIDSYLPAMPLQVSGTKYLFLVKGRREKDRNREGWRRTNNPLIKGYSLSSTDGMHYAHTYKYPHPENPSGFTTLGSRWSAFDVWAKYPNGVPGWIQDIQAGKIQAREVDPGWFLSQQAFSPVEKHVTKAECSLVKQQLVQINREISAKLDNVQCGRNPFVQFEQNRKSCHYPYDCPNLDICHGVQPFTDEPASPEVYEYPLQNGYEKRVPHHDMEFDQFLDRDLGEDD